MVSDDNHETNHKNNQGILDTSILLQAGTGNYTPEQQNISCIQWKLWGGNKIP